MDNELNCFVIIGYGKKTSYANGKLRVLDLDETYTLLIKPVFDALNISCYRAIDKNLNGSIDKVMLQEIKNADIAIVDISTLNANVMWELGVRHSLKPQHTIMICEKEQMNAMPFDVNHFVVHQYTHSEEGIPYKEVERFKTHLTTIIKGLLDGKSQATDSPVFTFLEDELNNADSGPQKAEAELPEEQEIPATRSQKPSGIPKMSSDESAENSKEMADISTTVPINESDSFASLMRKAEDAKIAKDYETALSLYSTAKKFASLNMTLKDNVSFIICRQALCTYKLKKPNELEAYQQAKAILQELNPLQSQDVEVLALSGAIEKRLNEITNEVQYLSNAIGFYERAFRLKQDYYNGINSAYMLYKKASILKLAKDDEWDDTKIIADYIRNTVLTILQEIEAKPTFLESREAIWVLLTFAEVYNYKRNETMMLNYEKKAEELALATKNEFAIDAYKEQKEKIKKIFETLN